MCPYPVQHSHLSLNSGLFDSSWIKYAFLISAGEGLKGEIPELDGEPSNLLLCTSSVEAPRYCRRRASDNEFFTSSYSLTVWLMSACSGVIMLFSYCYLILRRANKLEWEYSPFSEVPFLSF